MLPNCELCESDFPSPQYYGNNYVVNSALPVSTTNIWEFTIDLYRQQTYGNLLLTYIDNK